MVKQILPPAQRLRISQIQVVGVALLAARLNIFSVIQRPEPKLVPAMTFLDAAGRPAVAVVARSATKLLRIVNLQQLHPRVAGKGRFASHVRLSQRHGLPCAQVTGFAAVDQIHIRHVNLLDLRSERLHVPHQALHLSFRQSHQVVPQIGVARLPQLAGRLLQLDSLGLQVRLPDLQPIPLSL